MAKSFIYDSIGFSEAPLKAGTVAEDFAGSYTYTAAEAQITNEHRATDMSIGSAITSFDSNDAIRFDLGSGTSGTANVIAVHFNGAENSEFELYAGDEPSALGNDTLVSTVFSVSSSGGWNIFTFTETTIDSNSRWWHFVSTLETIENITEIIIGTKYDFDINFDLSNKIGEEFGTDIVTSYGGNEYSNKRHEPKTTWDWNWSFLTSSQRTSLDDLNSTVQDHKKFIYSEDGTTGPFHYVRMTKPMNFTEVASSIYSTSVSLREQLA